MIRTKILGFLLIFAALGFSTPVFAQTAKFKNWKIVAAKSGGYAGINIKSTLDSDGNLTRINKAQESFSKIERAKIASIAKLIKELELAGTKQKIVKGKRIYDGIYTSFIITLDGKDYRIEGTSFDDAKYLALTKRQKATLEKLKTELEQLGGFVPYSKNN